MKAELTEPKSFKPVSITLTFESQEELDALGTLLNCSKLPMACDAVFGPETSVAFSLLRRCLESAGADIGSKWNELVEAIKS